MKCHILVQCRASSTRLFGKCFLPLNNKALICQVVERLKRVKGASMTAVLIPDSKENHALELLLKREYIPYFKGSEDNVLSRYQVGAEHFGSEVVVRVTGDNPFIDPETIDSIIDLHLSSSADYTSSEGLPLGCGGEVISKSVLCSLNATELEPRHREHVTLYVRENPQIFNLQTFKVEGRKKEPSIRLTVDEEADYRVAYLIYKAFKKGYIPLDDVIGLIKKQPHITSINKNIQQITP